MRISCVSGMFMVPQKANDIVGIRVSFHCLSLEKYLWTISILKNDMVQAPTTADITLVCLFIK